MASSKEIKIPVKGKHSEMNILKKEHFLEIKGLKISNNN